MNVSHIATSAKLLTVFILAGLIVAPSYSSALMIDTGAEGGVSVTGEGVSTELKSETQVEMTTASTDSGDTGTNDQTLSAIVDSSLLTAELKAAISEFRGPVTPLIQTKADVDAYASIVAEGNDEVEDIKLESNELRVFFKERGKMFWVIPVTITSIAKVSGDGVVEVDRPWYGAFFTAKSEADLAADIESSLGNNAEVSIRAFAANATAVDQVELMRKVVTAIDANAEASADVAAKVE